MWDTSLAQEIVGEVGPSMLFSTLSPTQVIGIRHSASNSCMLQLLQLEELILCTLRKYSRKRCMQTALQVAADSMLSCSLATCTANT